jgi:hypothetical protein
MGPGARGGPEWPHTFPVPARIALSPIPCWTGGDADMFGVFWGRTHLDGHVVGIALWRGLGSGADAPWGCRSGERRSQARPTMHAPVAAGISSPSAAPAGRRGPGTSQPPPPRVGNPRLLPARIARDPGASRWHWAVSWRHPPARRCLRSLPATCYSTDAEHDLSAETARTTGSGKESTR